MFFFTPQQQQQQQRQRPTALYEQLGVSPGATASDIRKAYRKLALQYHPDKQQGQEERFKTIAAAYEVLSDAPKKAVYDAGGSVDGQQQQQQHNAQSFPPDMFHAFFHQQQQHQQQPLAPKTTMHLLQMSLEDLFRGKTFKHSIQRSVHCTDCNGLGGTNLTACSSCRGSKVQTCIRHLGPGFVQKIEQPCPVCKGHGSMPQTCCTKCQGSRRATLTQIAQVEVPAGSLDGYQVRRNGPAAEGDVVFMVQTKQHEVYRRQGCDLLIEKTLSLEQSLCGFEFHLRQIDGSAFVLQSQPGKITQPGSAVELPGLGMPTTGSSRRGRLLVTYRVDFPEAIAECKSLADRLPQLVAQSPCHI